jgi:polyferredoxin
MGKLFLLIVLVTIYKVNGNQFMMFNILERRFTIFYFFWPQDFYLFVLFMIIGIVFVILLRLFWTYFLRMDLPQTIFLEMVFRRIEYLIEGDRGASNRLHKQEWNAEKIRKKG